MERVTQKKSVAREVVSPLGPALVGLECAAFSTWVVGRLLQKTVPTCLQRSYHPHACTPYVGSTLMSYY